MAQSFPKCPAGQPEGQMKTRLQSVTSKTRRCSCMCNFHQTCFFIQGAGEDAVMFPQNRQHLLPLIALS